MIGVLVGAFVADSEIVRLISATVCDVVCQHLPAAAVDERDVTLQTIGVVAPVFSAMGFTVGLDDTNGTPHVTAQLPDESSSTVVR